MTYLFNFNSFNKLEDFSTFLKSLAISNPKNLFYLDCDKKDFLVFDGFDNIKRIKEEDKDSHFDAIFSSDLESNNFLFYLPDKERGLRSYVTVIDEEDEDSNINKNLIYASKIVSKFFEIPVSLSLISPSFEDKIKSSNIELGEKSNIKDIFTYKKRFILLSKRDYVFFRDTIDGYLLMNKEENNDKGLFSSLGSLFFKNYVKSKEPSPFKRYMSKYTIDLSNPSLSFNIIGEMKMEEWSTLFKEIEDGKFNRE